jgi:hypothetical protein
MKKGLTKMVTKAIDALRGAQHLIRNLGGQHDDLLDLIDAALIDLREMTDCPDCGATKDKMLVLGYEDCPDCGATEDKMLVLGFVCEHEKCPMFQSPAVKKAMNRFWVRLAKEDARRNHKEDDEE